MTPRDFLRLRDGYMAGIEKVESELATALRDLFIEGMRSEQVIEQQIKANLYGRARFMFHSVFPWSSRIRTIDGATVFEIGPGTGATTAALGMAAAAVHAFDIAESSAGIARLRCRLLGLENVTVTVSAPAEVTNAILAQARIRRPDIVLLFAVLEHMKIEERLETLKCCWDVLSDDGIVIVGDTPNRLVYRHGHTSRHPFFDMVPDELMLRYAEAYPNRDFGLAVQRWMEEGKTAAAITENIDRWGRGASFHEFELAIGNLAAHTACDGLESPMLRAIPLRTEEVLLMRFLNHALPDIPPGYARSALYLVLSKAPAKLDRELARQLLDNDYLRF